MQAGIYRNDPPRAGLEQHQAIRQQDCRRNQPGIIYREEGSKMGKQPRAPDADVK